MEAKGYNLPPEEDTETTVTIPRFDEKAEEAARPVVPLGPRVAVRTGRGSAWPQSLLLILAVAAGVMAGAAVVYLNTGSTVPPEAPPTSTEATVSAAPEPSPTQPEQGDVSDTSADVPRSSDARGRAPVQYEPEGSAPKEAERRGRDEAKLAERARKDEEKLARRERKEAEKRAERGREQEKSGGRKKAQLFDTITVKRAP